MRFVELAALFLTSTPFVGAEHSRLRLLHRLYHPTTPQNSFVERGIIAISEPNVVSFQLSSSYLQDLTTFDEHLRVVQGDPNLALYQVAVGREEDSSEAQWDVSSVKMCYLNHATAEFIYLHTLDTHDVKPYALDYFLSPVPHDGACQKSLSERLFSGSLASPLNTSVILRGTRFPPLPELTTPPPLSPEGEPIVPIPEKTFLQKYWVYLLVFAVAVVLSGGGEEEQHRR